MTSLNDVLAANDGEDFKSTGTLSKILQTGVLIEEDDEDFRLEPRKEG